MRLSTRLIPSWRHLRPVLLGAGLALGPALLVAAQLAPLPQFANGQVADAVQVNANLEALRSAVNATTSVGDVVSSVLTETQLQSARGTGWVLADGRNVAGSAYATLTGQTTIPDFRGLFLRGKNNARNDGKQNPDGELALGAYQADEIRSHEHGIQWWASGGSSLPNTFPSWPNAYNPNSNQATSRGVSASGGNEARPRNATVNHFIRIN